MIAIISGWSIVGNSYNPGEPSRVENAKPIVRKKRRSKPNRSTKASKPIKPKKKVRRKRKSTKRK